MASQSADQKADRKEKRFTMNELVDGVFLPRKMNGKVQPIAAHVQQLRQMKLRADDVFVCSYPKSGTHWLWEVCLMLRQGKAVYDDRPKVQLMMEFVDVEKLDEQPSPRTFNTHLPFSMLPVQELKDKRTKIVHVYRNPKDCLVSLYFMAKSGNFAMADKSLEDLVEYYISDKAPLCGYFGYLKQMADFAEANPDIPIFNVSFEDMKKDTVSNTKRLAKFLEVDVSDKVCEEIADACSFQKLKKGDSEKKAVQFGGDDEEKSEAKHNRAFIIFRKGEVGDWKNHLTVAMNEKLDAVIKEKMKGLPFTLQYT